MGDSDCAICCTDMGAPAYVAVGEGGEDRQDPPLRLVCGHAFHTGCVRHAFRHDTRCPVCRSTGGAVLEEPTSATTSTDDASAQEGDFTEADLLAVQRVQSSDAGVRAARTVFRAELRTFNLHCEGLKSERRRLIAAALRTLRATHRPAFRTRARRLRATLDDFKAAAHAALAREGRATEGTRAIVDSYAIAGRGADDPLRRRFWLR
jgi:hypothetical protein